MHVSIKVTEIHPSGWWIEWILLFEPLILKFLCCLFFIKVVITSSYPH